MKIYDFVNDYSEGAAPEILARLVETNMEKLPGYGSDRYTEAAKEKIREACHAPDAEIYFLTGGTQTNQVIIASLLKSYEGVVAAETGHVNVHEAGAIELTGHKVLAVREKEGKLTAGELEKYLAGFFADENREHMVQPGMVYITHPTEYGTLYSKAELAAVSEVCRKYKLPLYLDGARLGYGLAAAGTDVTLPDIANFCDAFYIGGTKIGALCGEAAVFKKEALPEHFLTLIKQHGALLAKGRLTGVQFDVLFTDGLYLRISKNAIDTAKILKEAFRAKDYEFFIDSPTNQIFIKLENTRMEELKKIASFSFWEKADDCHTVVRFATSWATSPDEARELAALL